MDDKLTPRELRAWRNFLSVSVQITEQLDHELQKDGHLSLTDYEILHVLAGSPEMRLRMSELARHVLVSRSRLTYRIDRLAEVDYVTREECEDDRRGLWAILTDTGKEALERATPDHHRAIRRLFLEPLSSEELEELDGVLERMAAKLDAFR